MTRYNHLYMIGTVLMLGLGLAGCAVTRLDVQTAVVGLHQELPSDWAAAPNTAATPVTSGLLDLFDDEHLRTLVTEALSANPDLRAAAHRLTATRRLETETGAARLPVVEAGYYVNGHNGALNLQGERMVESNHRLSVGIAWELDVWQRLANVHAATTAMTESQASDLAAARDALAARVVQAWVATVAQGQALDVERQRIEILSRLQATIRSRYRRGIGDIDDLSAANASIELSRATALIIQGDQEQTVRHLELLLGRPPRAALLVAEQLPSISEAGAGYPLVALTQRHDVAASLWRLTAADHDAASAAKDMLPALKLTGEVAKDRTALSTLLSVNPVWSLLGSLTQPLFDSGARRARSDAKKLELEAAWEDYRSTVLRAIGEVEDALGRERILVGQRDHLVNAYRESLRTACIQESRYRRGLSSIMELLQARDQEMDTRRQVIAVEGEILSNRVTLALAVGATCEEQP